jgi:hypothetical protein
MMQQQVKEVPTDAEAGQLQRSGAAEAAPVRRDAAALWRALAGMAISVALACLIVMLEFTGQAAHRAARMHRHAEVLLSRVSRLETEIAAERARIATAHRELAAAEALRSLLRAPDAGMLLLAPPGATGEADPVGAHGGAAAHGSAGAPHRPEATLALAPRERRAVLIVAGLKPPANDSLFVLWWSVSHGAPVRAAEFRTAADGSALVTAALPPGLNVTAAMVTAEQAAKSGAASASQASPASSAQTGPVGPVQLRGSLAR